MTLQRGVLPTLTEVIEIPAQVAPAPAAAAPLPPEALPLDTPAAADLRTQAAQRAMAAELELRLEAQIRQRLEPELAALIDRSVDKLRAELNTQAQQMIHQAIDDVLAAQHKA